VGVSKIVKSQIESNSQPILYHIRRFRLVCQRSSNHKLKAIHNFQRIRSEGYQGVSKIVKSQIESNSQLVLSSDIDTYWCVKDRQITNWKQFTTSGFKELKQPRVCQRSSNHKLKAIHNLPSHTKHRKGGVSKIVKSQIESNSQPCHSLYCLVFRCVKDRQITNWKQFTTAFYHWFKDNLVCQRSSNHKLKAIHNNCA